jgi:4-amino-4-deoxy-L-arabinose transferase-like glycosyltransferase
MDSIEAVVWGQYCDWGTNKHPPLSGWLAYAFYTLGGGSAYGVYALSQICVLTGFAYLYRLSRFFFDREKAVVSVMLLEGVIYYGFSAPEFNVNVVSLALWPMTAYYAYRALTENKLRDWLLLGFVAGLNLLNKYVGGFVLAALALAVLFEPSMRKRLRAVGPYLAALTALVVIFPHVYWLYQHDFFVIDYFLGRGGQGASLPFGLSHAVYPLKFLGAQILFSAGTLLIYLYATNKAEKETDLMSPFQRRFVIWLGIVPFVLMFVFSVLTGMKLKSMWGFPVLYMLGIVLQTFRPYKMSARVFDRFQKGVYLLMILMAVALACIFTFNKSDKVHLDAALYGNRIEDLWRQQNGDRPFKYVAGDVWWADNAALYSPSRPKPVIWGDLSKNPWFDANDFARSGALMIAAGVAEYKALAQTLGSTDEPEVMEIELKNLIGQTKRKTLYYGFFSAEDNK